MSCSGVLDVMRKVSSVFIAPMSGIVMGACMAEITMFSLSDCLLCGMMIVVMGSSSTRSTTETVTGADITVRSYPCAGLCASSRREQLWLQSRESMCPAGY